MPNEVTLFSAAERRFAEAVQRMNASNPFLPERIAAERAALGAEFEERGADWNKRPPTTEPSSNHAALTAGCGEVVDRIRADRKSVV